MRRTELRRKTPLTARTPLIRRTRLTAVSLPTFPGAGPRRNTRLRSKPHRIPARLRAQVCAAALGRCQACMLPCADGDVHHRLQRSLGGRDELDNLCWLDRACHRAVHEHIARSHELGLLVHSWQDPAAVPVRPWLAYLEGSSA